MNSKLTNIISLLIEELPVAVATGLIAMLLGAGIVGGQTAGAGAPATPLGWVIGIGVALILIGASVIGAPLITVFVSQRAAASPSNSAPADNDDR